MCVYARLIPLIRAVMQFPPLPPGPQHSANAQTAHVRLQSKFDHAVRVLRQEDGDSLRLKVLEQDLISVGLPLLEAIAEEDRLEEWVRLAVECIAVVIVALREAAAASEGR
jgi:hypothetical protein